MKPDWDQLMDKYESNEDVLVAEVDCTSEGGKPICEQNGVEGFPTIKFGDAMELQNYNGGRTYEDFLVFAGRLGPLCSVYHKEKCTPGELEKLEAVEAMSVEDLEKEITEANARLQREENDFRLGVSQLQVFYQMLSDKKKKVEAEITASGLNLKKSILAYKKKGSSGGDETKEEL